MLIGESNKVPVVETIYAPYIIQQWDEEAGYIVKWLHDYQLNECIKPEWSVGDESSCDFDGNDTIIVYDKEEIKFMIKLLQTLCIDHNFDDEEIDKRLE